MEEGRRDYKRVPCVELIELESVAFPDSYPLHHRSLVGMADDRCLLGPCYPLYAAL